MLEARAINRYIGSSPRKMRLVIDLIRGKSVDEALSTLHFLPNHASRYAEKVVRSAVSNIHNKDEGSRLELHDMFIKEAYVDGGPTMKRVLPAPFGRAFRILKRSNHITVVIAEKPKKTTKATKPVKAKEETKPVNKKAAEQQQEN